MYNPHFKSLYLFLMDLKRWFEKEKRTKMKGFIHRCPLAPLRSNPINVASFGQIRSWFFQNSSPAMSILTSGENKKDLEISLAFIEGQIDKVHISSISQESHVNFWLKVAFVKKSIDTF